jgi:hypothetical protein
LLRINATGAATFSSTVTSNGFRGPNFTTTAGGVNVFQVGADSYSGGFYVYDETNASYRFKIANGGAATFSSSVTATQGIFKNSGVPAILAYRDLDVTVVGTAGQGIEFGARSGSTFISGASIYGALDNPATTGLMVFQTLTAGSLTTKMTITSAGFVGIGTASPEQLLDVKNSGGGTAYALIQGQGRKMYLGQDGTGATIYSDGAVPMWFSTNGTERMRIDASGNLIIGGTSPTGKLTVQASSDGNLFSIRGSLSAYGYPNIIEMGQSGADGYLNIKDGAGNVQSVISGYAGTPTYFLSSLFVGTSTNSGYKFDVSGTGRFSNSSGDTLVLSKPSGASINLQRTSATASSFAIAVDPNFNVYNYTAGTTPFSISASTGAATFSGTVEALRYNATSSSASLPAYATASGAGMFNLGSDVGFSTNSTERMRITSTGQFIVGDTSLAYANSIGYVAGFKSAFTGQTILSIARAGQTLASQGMFIGLDTTTSYFWNRDNIAITFGTNDTEKMRITSGGNVGIGTGSPSQKLHVIGNAWINRPSNKVDNGGGTEFGSRVEFNNAFVAGSTGYMVFTYPSASVFRMYADYDGNLGGVQPDIQLGLGHLTIKSAGATAGNVGIGTTSPTSPFHVNSSSQLRARFYSSSASSFLDIENGGGSFYVGRDNSTGSDFGVGAYTSVIWSNGAYPMVFSTNNAERMRITSGGSVGIGTTSPSRKLEVYAVDPSFALKSSTTTGYSELYFADSASDSVGFISYAHSTDSMVLGTSGSTRLTIASTGAATFSSSVTATNYLASATESFRTYNDNGYISFFDSSNTTRNGYLQIQSTALTLAAEGASSFMLFATGGGSERMRITASGNVGINTASPGYTLDVNGGTAFRDTLRLLASGVNAVQLSWTSSNTGLINLLHSGMINTQILANGNSYFLGGSIGIGTSTPSRLLHISAPASNHAYQRIEGGSGGYGGFLELMANSVGSGTDSAGRVDFYMTSSNRIAAIDAQRTASGANYGTLVFSTANNSIVPTERMRITYDGLVGIGTTSPQTELHVKASTGWAELRIDGASGNGSSLEYYTNGMKLGDIYCDTSNNMLFRNSGSNERMRITSVGDVLVNATMTTQSAKFYVNGKGAFGSLYIGNLGTGTVYSNMGNLTNTNPSDYRLKNTIKPLTYGLNEVLQLNPKTFYYNDDVTKARLKYGFIAQEVKDVMPDLVRKLEGSTDYLGLENEAIFVTLVNAIKEQQAQINELKSQLNK